jgi:hypothetical protein
VQRGAGLRGAGIGCCVVSFPMGGLLQLAVAVCGLGIGGGESGQTRWAGGDQGQMVELAIMARRRLVLVGDLIRPSIHPAARGCHGTASDRDSKHVLGGANTHAMQCKQVEKKECALQRVRDECPSAPSAKTNLCQLFVDQQDLLRSYCSPCRPPQPSLPSEWRQQQQHVSWIGPMLPLIPAQPARP